MSVRNHLCTFSLEMPHGLRCLYVLEDSARMCIVLYIYASSSISASFRSHGFLMICPIFLFFCVSAQLLCDTVLILPMSRAFCFMFASAYFIMQLPNLITLILSSQLLFACLFCLCSTRFSPSVESRILFCENDKSKPPVERVVRASLKRAECRQIPYRGIERFRNSLRSRAASIAACFYAFVFLLPVNGSTFSLSETSSAAISSANWFLIYSAFAFLLRPSVFTQYSLRQKCRFA